MNQISNPTGSSYSLAPQKRLALEPSGEDVEKTGNSYEEDDIKLLSPSRSPRPKNIPVFSEPENCKSHAPASNNERERPITMISPQTDQPHDSQILSSEVTKLKSKEALSTPECSPHLSQVLLNATSATETNMKQLTDSTDTNHPQYRLAIEPSGDDSGVRLFQDRIPREVQPQRECGYQTLVSIAVDTYTWLQRTFPTVKTAGKNLPFALVPFGLSMFVLVKALVNKGWVTVFVYG